MWFWVLEKLPGVGSWLKKAFLYLFGHPMAAAALLFGLYAMLEHHNAGKWQKQAEHCAEAHKADVALAEKKSAESETIAEVNHARFNQYVAENRALADRYRAGNRVLSRPAGAGQDQGPVVLDGSALPPLMVAISDPDLDSCTDWVSYGQGAHDWVQSLIDKGLAEVSDDATP